MINKDKKTKIFKYLFDLYNQLLLDLLSAK